MSLSKQETEFLTTFSAAGKQVFTFTQAAGYWQSAAAATNSLGRLVRKGWLQRLERGLYLIIPLEAGPNRIWSENAFILASRLITPGALAYWSALRFWNMTDQVPRVQFIQTTKRKRPIIIQGTEYKFIQVAERFYFGITTRQVGGSSVTVTDREKNDSGCGQPSGVKWRNLPIGSSSEYLREFHRLGTIGSLSGSMGWGCGGETPGLFG